METGRNLTNKSVFELSNGDAFRVSFTNDILIENIGSNVYSFNLYTEKKEIIGSGELGSYTWMSFPSQGIQSYSIEFFDLEGNLVDTYYNNLNDINGSKILFNVKFPSQPGKAHNMSLLDESLNDLAKKYNKCEMYVYFKGSEKYDFTGKSYSPVRMNDNISHFNIMTDLYV